MTYHKSRFSVCISLDNVSTIGSWISYGASKRHKISVSNPNLMSLEHIIKQLQHLPTKQLIISINNHKDLIRLTILLGRLIQIRHCHSPLLVNNNFKFIFWNLMVPSIDPHPLTSLIFRSIINKNNMIITIVLHQNGIHVMDVTILCCIVKTWDDDTKRELFIFWKFVLLFVVGFLFYCCCWVFWLVFQVLHTLG